MKFDVNDYVWVKLTDLGRDMHREYWEPYSNGRYRPPDESNDGWSRYQMHELMRIFGKSMTLGFNTPFETTIWIGNDPPQNLD